MGAMQAQDYNMAKWAIGIRLPGSTDESVEKVLKSGEIIRTHLLRPTWHLVSADDIYWILELTAPHIKPLMRSRHLQLGLTETIINKCKTIVENALTGGIHLTRDELMMRLVNTGLVSESPQVYHLMMLFELDNLICSAVPNGKKQTYGLLQELIPKPPSIHRDEALTELAKRYFASHGPATIQDFIWWSGLPVKDARNALENIKSGFKAEKYDEQTYWLSDSYTKPTTELESAYLLPAYDEFIISYRDRTASLLAEHHKKAISENGLFRPVIVVNGKVKGIWRRTQKKNVVIIETDYFQAISRHEKTLVEEAAIRYGKFLGQEAQLINFDS